MIPGVWDSARNAVGVWRGFTGLSEGMSLLKPGKITQWEDEIGNKSRGAARKQDRGAGDPSP